MFRERVSGYVPGLSELLVLQQPPTATTTNRVTITPTTPTRTTPTPTKSGRPRDTQKSKLYRAEVVLESSASAPGKELAAAKGGTGGRWPSITECQAYVDNLCRQRFFQSRWGQVKVEVGRKTNGHATGTRHSRWSGTIQLPPWSRTEPVILHEVAHVLTPPGCAAHGPEFAAILLTLVRHRVGKDAAANLRAAYGEHHVKYRNGMHAVPKANTAPVLTGRRPSVKAAAAVQKLTEEQHTTLVRMLRRGLAANDWDRRTRSAAADLLHALERS